MINVLHLIHKYRGDYSLLNAQVSLDPQRFRTTVCYLSGADDGRNRLERPGVEAVYLEHNPKRLRWYNRALLQDIARLIDAEQIDVVNCQQHRSVPVGVLAVNMSRRRPACVATLHGLGTARTWQRKLFNRPLYRRLFKVVGVSEGVSRDILASNPGLAAEKVCTIRNGVDLSPFLANFEQADCRAAFADGDPQELWIGTAGRLAEVKNQTTLLAAMPAILEVLPAARLLIAGQGVLESSLREQAASLGIAERVTFVGQCREMPTFLNALDLFVLPSLREGFGLALIEAMACRLPVVAAAVGGIPEVVGAGRFARLIQPTDVSGLCQAVCELGQLSRAERLQMGDEARTRALAEFNVARMVREYEELYSSAAELRTVSGGG